MNEEYIREVMNTTCWADVFTFLKIKPVEFLGVYMIPYAGSGEDVHFVECRRDCSFECEFCIESGKSIFDFFLFYLAGIGYEDQFEEFEDQFEKFIKQFICFHDPRQMLLFHPATMEGLYV